MRVLITSSRLPFALRLIRAFGESGHEVHAVDSFRFAAGGHSRHAHGRRHHVASPRYGTEDYIERVAALVEEHDIDLVLPTFEEIFYLARHRDQLPAPVFASPHDVLMILHDKRRFCELVSRLDLPVPPTTVATDAGALSAAISDREGYVARPAYSRMGHDLITNLGPRAGELAPNEVECSEAVPWIVQEFVTGPLLCTYSTLHDGHVTLHSSYRVPRQLEATTGIQFEAVDAARTLPVVERIGGELGFTGQMCLDFIDSDDGVVLIECNPRTTNGVLLLSSRELVNAIVDPTGPTRVVGPGKTTQLDAGLVIEALRDHTAGHWREALHDLAHVPDAVMSRHDPLPAVFQLASLAYAEHYGHLRHLRFSQAFVDDLLWNVPATDTAPQ